jgi:hypothetical protein
LDQILQCPIILLVALLQCVAVLHGPIPVVQREHLLQE